MTLLVAIATLCVCTWIFLLAYWSVVTLATLRRLRRLQAEPPAEPQPTPGVSIIVYAHNAAEALASGLPHLLGQDWPDLEVIVVDDCSLDDTQDVLAVMQQRDGRLYHTRVGTKVRTISHRKLALLLGVKAAHGDIILTIPAGAIPQGTGWVRHMVRHMSTGIDIVLGPVAYSARTSASARLCCWDLFERLTDLFGLTLTAGPYAGWGHNMAFRREVLFEQQNRAFASHLGITPGEDDLFVSEVARMRREQGATGRRSAVAVEVSPEAVVTLQPVRLSEAWSGERLERACTSRRYRRAPRRAISADRLCRFLFVGSALALIAQGVSLLLGFGGLWAMPQAVHADPRWSWELIAIPSLLLLTRMLWLASGAWLTSQALGLRPFVFTPVVYDLVTPLIDVWFRLKYLIKRKSFTVARR